MKKYILIVLSLLAIGLGAEIHDEAGNYGYKFLNIAPSPVSIAMAGRGLHSGINSAAWLAQPALSCMENGKRISVNHSAWIGDTAFSTAMYSNAQRVSHIGLAIRNLNYNEIEQRDETGLLIGHYNPVDMAITGNYAFRLDPNLYAGINLGLIYQKLDTASSLGVNADMGFTVLPPLQDSRISLSLRNFGASNKTTDEYITLPYSIEMDFSKGISVIGYPLALEAGMQMRADKDLQYTFGSELNVHNTLFLRGGYKLNYDAESFTAGLGARLGSFGVDYGFAVFTDGLSDVHSVGLQYNF